MPICLVDIDCTGQPPANNILDKALKQHISFFLEVKIYPNHSCKGRNCMVHMHLHEYIYIIYIIYDYINKIRLNSFYLHLPLKGARKSPTLWPLQPRNSPSKPPRPWGKQTYRTPLLRFAWAITLKQCTRWVRNIAMDKDFKKIKSLIWQIYFGYF